MYSVGQTVRAVKAFVVFRWWIPYEAIKCCKYPMTRYSATFLDEETMTTSTTYHWRISYYGTDIDGYDFGLFKDCIATTDGNHSYSFANTSSKQFFPFDSTYDPGNQVEYGDVVCPLILVPALTTGTITHVEKACNARRLLLIQWNMAALDRPIWWRHFETLEDIIEVVI